MPTRTVSATAARSVCDSGDLDMGDCVSLGASDVVESATPTSEEAGSPELDGAAEDGVSATSAAGSVAASSGGVGELAVSTSDSNRMNCSLDSSTKDCGSDSAR